MASSHQLYNIFLSFSHKHVKSVSKVYERLKKEGYQIWVTDGVGAERRDDVVKEKTHDGILNSDFVVCFISKDYCESAVCVSELEKIEEENKNCVYVMLDDLRKYEFQQNIRTREIHLIIKYKPQLYAFKPTRAFEPWSEELFAELLDVIMKAHETSHPVSRQLKQNLDLQPDEKVFKRLDIVVEEDYQAVAKTPGSVASFTIRRDKLQKFNTQQDERASQTPKVITRNQDYQTLKTPATTVLSPAPEPTRNYNSLKHAQLVHEESIKCLLSLGADVFASASSDGSIKVWGANLACVEDIPKAHKAPIKCLALLNDDRFASGSKDKSIKIWSSVDFTLLKHIEQAHATDVNCVAMLNNEYFASGSDEKSIKIWHSSSYSCVKLIKLAHHSPVWCLLPISSDHFASGSHWKSLRIWSMKDFSCVTDIRQAHENSIRCLIKLNNDRFASGSWDASIKIWSCVDFSCLKHIKKAHGLFVHSLIMINNNLFASCSQDKSIKIWSSTDYNCVKSFRQAHEASVEALIMVNSCHFASASQDKSIKTWNPND